jgi:adsorption protein B
MSAQTIAVLSQLLDVLQFIERELLLFACFWFVVGACDELVVDLIWLGLRLTGRTREARLPAGFAQRPLSGRIAVIVAAWQEAEVIGTTVAHALRAWPQADLRLYVGCYANDPATVQAVMAGAARDPRVRIVVNPRPGPSTKADCLNRIYRAIGEDEARGGAAFTGVLMHDAEDMVHPAALAAVDRALAEVDFVQLPVRPEPQAASPWVAGHYGDEFTESHAKSLVVRDVLGAGIPAAGVGCGFARGALARLAAARGAEGEAGPFAADCLTEDYELGLLVGRGGDRSRFLRLRDHDGTLVATRAYFPATVEDSVRQKARWIHGIALQGWDRLGWTARPVDLWMTLRDRRGPMMAVVLAVAYVLVAVEGLLALARQAGWQAAMPLSPLLGFLLALTLASALWRLVFRFAFTAGEYGIAEGGRAVPRVLVANYIAILAGRDAVAAYVRTLRGEGVRWDKTRHDRHPALAATGAPAGAASRAASGAAA